MEIDEKDEEQVDEKRERTKAERWREETCHSRKQIGVKWEELWGVLVFFWYNNEKNDMLLFHFIFLCGIFGLWLFRKIQDSFLHADVRRGNYCLFFMWKITWGRLYSIIQTKEEKSKLIKSFYKFFFLSIIDFYEILIYTTDCMWFCFIYGPTWSPNFLV